MSEKIFPEEFPKNQMPEIIPEEQELPELLLSDEPAGTEDPTSDIAADLEAEEEIPFNERFKGTIEISLSVSDKKTHNLIIK